MDTILHSTKNPAISDLNRYVYRGNLPIKCWVLDTHRWMNLTKRNKINTFHLYTVVLWFTICQKKTNTKHTNFPLILFIHKSLNRYTLVALWITVLIYLSVQQRLIWMPTTDGATVEPKVRK